VVNKRKNKAKTRTVSRRSRLPSRKKVSKSIGSQWGKITKGISVLAFLSNITGSDMAASAGQPIGARAQNFGNSLLGRITGFTPFKNAPGANTPQTVSLDGIFNKWSGGGLLSLVYGMLPIKQLPHRAKAKTLGKGLLTAGILSGIFMPTNNRSSNLITPSRAITVSSSEVSYT
tara:strand:- start:270 stop:791 length:522 start_codon:yes stop_codon:yes gene_type:complete